MKKKKNLKVFEKSVEIVKRMIVVGKKQRKGLISGEDGFEQTRRLLSSLAIAVDLYRNEKEAKKYILH